MKLHESSPDIPVSDLILFVKYQSRVNGGKTYPVFHWNEYQWKQLEEEMAKTNSSFLAGNQYLNCKHQKV